MEAHRKKFTLMRDSLNPSETLIYLARQGELDFHIMILEKQGNKLLYAGVGTDLKLLELTDRCGRLRNMELYFMTPYFLKIDREHPETANVKGKSFRELTRS